jgi:hypothetical protein
MPLNLTTKFVVSDVIIIIIIIIITITITIIRPIIIILLQCE